jgi:hypothetical protein
MIALHLFQIDFRLCDLRRDLPALLAVAPAPSSASR